MTRLLWLLISVFVCVPALDAQTPQYQDTILHNARTSAVGGTIVNVSQANTIRLDILITGTATVSFNISGAGNYAWYPKLCTASDSTSPVTSTDATGVFFCQVAAGNAFQAPITSYTSGAVSAVVRVSTAF